MCPCKLKVCTWDSVLCFGNKAQKIHSQSFPTAILFKVIMCLLPDDSQIYIPGLYIPVFLFITCQETSIKLPTLQLFSYRRGFMIMAISAETMLQKSGLAFKNFHQTIENLIMNHLDFMIYVLVR
jgi:hypothetical protein